MRHGSNLLQDNEHIIRTNERYSNTVQSLGQPPNTWVERQNKEDPREGATLLNSRRELEEEGIGTRGRQGPGLGVGVQNEGHEPFRETDVSGHVQYPHASNARESRFQVQSEGTCLVGLASREAELPANRIRLDDI